MDAKALAITMVLVMVFSTINFDIENEHLKDEFQDEYEINAMGSQTVASTKSTDALAVFVRPVSGSPDETEIYYSIRGHDPKIPKPVSTPLTWEWWSQETNGDRSDKIPGSYDGSNSNPTVAFSRELFAVVVWSNLKQTGTVQCYDDQIPVRQGSLMYAVWNVYDQSWSQAAILIQGVDDEQMEHPSLAIDNNGNGLVSFTRLEIQRDDGCPSQAITEIKSAKITATKNLVTEKGQTVLDEFEGSYYAVMERGRPVSAVSFSAKLSDENEPFTKQEGLVVWWSEAERYEKECDNNGNSYTQYIQTYWPKYEIWEGSGFQNLDDEQYIPDKMTPPNSLDDDLSIMPGKNIAISTDSLSEGRHNEDESPLEIHSHIQVDWIVSKQQGDFCDQSTWVTSKEAWSGRYAGIVKGGVEGFEWVTKANKIKELSNQAESISVAFTPNDDGIVVHDQGNNQEVEWLRQTYDTTQTNGEITTESPVVWKNNGGLGAATGMKPQVVSMAHQKTLVLWQSSGGSDAVIKWNEIHNSDLLDDSGDLWTNDNQEIGTGHDVDVAALTGSPTLPHAEWNFITYSAGDNDLWKWFASGDTTNNEWTIGESQEVVGSSNMVNVVSFYDNNHDFNTATDCIDECYVYEKKGTGTELPPTLPANIDSSDADTLEDFLAFSLEYYPSKRNLINLGDHGSGWYGACWDYRNNGEKIGDAISPAELNGALSAVNKKMDIIGFNACRMGMVEIAYEIRDWGEYMVASEEVEIGIKSIAPASLQNSRGKYDGGWPYDLNLKHFTEEPHASTETLSTYLVTDYETNWEDSRFDRKTMSSMELDKIDELADSIDEFADLVISEATVQNIRDIRINAKYSERFYEPNQKDLQHFADKVAADTYLPDRIRDAAGNISANVTAVIDGRTRAGSGHPNANGIAIWLPLMKAVYTPIVGTYRMNVPAFTTDTSWDEFLDKIKGSSYVSASLESEDELKFAAYDDDGNYCGFNPESGDVDGLCSSIDRDIEDCHYIETSESKIVILSSDTSDFNWIVYGTQEEADFNITIEVIIDDVLVYTEVISGTVEADTNESGNYVVLTSPSAPVNLNYEVTDGGVELTWEPPENDGGLAVDEYNIYRGNSTESLELLATVENVSYLDAGYSGFTEEMFYNVTAVNVMGESEFSEGVSTLPPVYDDDGDGISNENDLCPDTPSGAVVDANGCAVPEEVNDADGDGVDDENDQCPDTAPGTNVDTNGCAIIEEVIDTDGDGVEDENDQCPNTPAGTAVDENGCKIEVKDPKEGIPGFGLLTVLISIALVMNSRPKRKE